MMQHERRQHDVDHRLAKRQGLDSAFREQHVDAGAPRLGARPRNHFRRGVNAVDGPVVDLALGEDRQRARAAADVQHVLAGF
jgi:hypothetical protein